MDTHTHTPHTEAEGGSDRAEKLSTYGEARERNKEMGFICYLSCLAVCNAVWAMLRAMKSGEEA